MAKTKKVKGVWLIDYVKMINLFLKNMPAKKGDDKKERFNQLLPPTERLTAEDWEIIGSMILPSVKYDYESFQRIGNAVFKIVANSQLNLVRAFGQGFMKSLLDLYKNLLVAGSPLESIEKFCGFHGLYFHDVTSRAHLVRKALRSATVELVLTLDDNKYSDASKAFAYQLGGSLEQLVAQAKGFKEFRRAGVTLEIIEEANGKYVYNIAW